MLKYATASRATTTIVTVTTFRVRGFMGGQRKVFTTPLLSEAKSYRNTEQFTKKKSRCQRGGVRGVANQYATTERTNPQTERCSKDEAAALRKNHVVRFKRYLRRSDCDNRPQTAR